jgi:transcriptional regulator with XRE-family HTH domain
LLYLFFWSHLLRCIANLGPTSEYVFYRRLAILVNAVYSHEASDGGAMQQPGQKIEESQVVGHVLAQVIVQLREKKGFKQSDLAARSGISQPVISRIEAGKQQPTLYQYSQLANALGTDVAGLEARVREAMARAKNMVATQTEAAAPAQVWNQAVLMAGLVGLLGLIGFAVAAALTGETPGNGPKPPQPPQPPGAA